MTKKRDFTIGRTDIRTIPAKKAAKAPMYKKELLVYPGFSTRGEWRSDHFIRKRPRSVARGGLLLKYTTRLKENLSRKLEGGFLIFFKSQPIWTGVFKYFQKVSAQFGRGVLITYVLKVLILDKIMIFRRKKVQKNSPRFARK